MTSSEIVQAYGAKLEGQQLLFPDDDIVVRRTKFKPIDPEFDKKALIHWWMHVYVPDGYDEETKTPQEVFSSWSNALYTYFKYTMIGGYKADTRQSCVKISAYKKEPVEPQIEELKLWLPHIKSAMNENANRIGKYVDIFEHNLSRFDSWYAFVYDAEFVIYRGRWEDKKFNSIEQFMEYIVKHLWYEKKRSNYAEV